jgi:hypothetical protein
MLTGTDTQNLSLLCKARGSSRRSAKPKIREHHWGGASGSKHPMQEFKRRNCYLWHVAAKKAYGNAAGGITADADVKKNLLEQMVGMLLASNHERRMQRPCW